MDKRQVSKIELAWKKWADKAVGAAEKKVIKETIDKLLTKNGWSLDWKSGIVRGQATNASQQPKQEAKPTGDGGWTTSDLAAHVSKATGKAWTTKMLRRYLRQMPEYNDGKMTHYRWSGPQDAMVKKVVEFITGKQGKTA